jgi:hypothetical protein
MNIVGISFGSKELPKRQFTAKQRNAVLQNKEKLESEFYKMMQEGLLSKNEKTGKIEFRKPEKGEMGL